MSYSDSIKKLLGIKDPNIEIQEITEEKDKKGRYKLIKGTLIPPNFKKCPLCGFDSLVKNGTKKSKILINRVNNQRAYLRLRKQRYTCKNCDNSCTASTYLVDKNCFISNQVQFKILDELTENQSMKNIGKHVDVSSTTVMRTLRKVEGHVKVKRNWLPKCLLFDEFRSLKNQYEKFSFSCMDGDTGKVLDILPSRKLNDLARYFMSFERKARLSVRYIVTDMNMPYSSLIKKCFPNAQLIVDRFHIVQHLIRCFDNVRKRIMKTFSKENAEYKQLKRYFRLLLKDEDALDFVHFVKRQSFKWRYLTESEIVDQLLSFSDELKEAYFYYQNLKEAFHQKNMDSFYSALNAPSFHLSPEFYPLKKTFNHFKKGIQQAFIQPYTNAKLENLHTHIKNMKRTAYGFKNFKNMRLLILLKNHCVVLTK